jgi:hypothetical protein
MTNSTFPQNANLSNGKDNIAIQLFGNRIFADQSLYEYIIEFLLVFVSPKNEDKETDKMCFHSHLDSELEYYVKPRMGLKRFIFYEHSKKDIKIEADEKAYKEILELLKGKIGDRNANTVKIKESIEAIQDLFYGYAAVLKNRSWTAQALLPIAPELIFCEAMLRAKDRINLNKDNEKYTKDKSNDTFDTDVEMKFDYSRHNFMSRGGEVYYLHILQALGKCTCGEKENLQKLLRNLITANNPGFSSIANWIDDSWIKSQNINPEKLWLKKTIGFIPATGYIDCGKHTISELTTFLSSEMHPITRIELLSKGIILQVMRMMCARTNEYLELKSSPWVVDLRSKKSGNTVMKISADSYRGVEELFVNAINKKTSEYIERVGEEDTLSPFEYLAHSKKHTLNMFKRLGKEMKCIIPLKGGYERFSLSEDLVKFLVLSLVKPQGKITFDMFLDKLYEHFNMVIGPKQYKKCVDNVKFDKEQADAFRNNELEFQVFLKNTGFLHDLSDATSIVVNPYREVVLGD